jgi:transposase
VKKFVQATKGKLRLFSLPPYSPELNPDELVWTNVKGKIGQKKLDQGAGEIKTCI